MGREEAMFRADFPPEEYKTRYDKAREQMGVLGIDALLLSLGIHLRYMAGYRTPFWGDAPGIPLAIIPRDPGIAPALILSRYGEFTAGSSWIEDVRYVRPDTPAPFGDACSLAVDTIRGKGLAKGTIAMDVGTAVLDNMPSTAFDKIRDDLPDAHVVDASSVMSRLRQVKSTAEVEVLKSACHTTCEAWRAGLEALKAGISEKEVAAVACRTILDVGEEAGLVRPWIMWLASGREMATWCNILPSNYRLQEGDLVVIDGGCSYKGYICDMMRWGSIGEPDAEDGYLFEVAIEATARCQEAVRPGVSCDEIYRIGARVFEKSRIDHELWKVFTPAGHGVGLEVHEAPVIAAGNETLLEPGMVVTMEPLVVKTHGGRFSVDPEQRYQGRAPDMFVVEDIVLVTDGGHELLTPLQPYVFAAG